MSLCHITCNKRTIFLSTLTMQGVNMGDVAPVQHVMSDPPPAQQQQQQQRRKRVSFPPGAHVKAVRLFDKQKPATEYQQQHQYASIDPATCSSILLGHLQLVFAGGKPLRPLMPSAERLLKQLRKQGLRGLSIHPEPAAFKDYEKKAEVCQRSWAGRGP